MHIISAADFPLFCSKMPFSAGSRNVRSKNRLFCSKFCRQNLSKPGDWYQTREVATGAKFGKTRPQFETRENIQLASNARKYAAGAKRGKTCCRRQTREDMPPASNAGKITAYVKHRKTCCQ